jgi:hypothetical protein
MARGMRTSATLLIAATMVVAGCSRSVDQPPEAKSIVITEPTDSMTVDESPAAKGDDAPPAEQGQFTFPNDSGGRALAKTLAPAIPPPMPPMPPGAPAAPRERRLPPIHEAPLPTRPVALGPPPRLAILATKEPRPVALPERVPQSLGGLLPDLPPRGELPTGPLVRQDGRDIAKPAELPILSAKPVADRAPLTDPTLEFTARSVINPTLPFRTTPAGFIRIPVPDPFEHADGAKPRTPVVDDPNRSLGSPPPPRQ